MLLRSFTILGVFALVGCGLRESKEVAEARDLYWMAPDGRIAAHVGSVPETEVDRLRVEIKKLSFPVRESVAMTLLPMTVKAKAIVFSDFGSVDEKGRVGGMIEDYWLNASSVMRVATAYYSVAGEHYNCKEWIEIIDPVHAYTDRVSVVRK
jgi:hypothetical protein